MLFIYSVAKTQLRNAPFGTSPRLAARSLSRTGRFFASASRPRCWVVMQGYEVRTCSAAPRFKTVTASLGHSFVPSTWKLIHSVHMTHEKRAFVLRDKSSFLSEACLTAREAALRAGKVLRREVSAEVCGTLPFPSCEARSFTAALPPLHIAPARSFTLRSAQTFMKKQSVPVTAGPDAAYRFRNPRRRSRPADSVWYMGRIQNA